MNKLEQLHLDAMRNFYSAHNEEYIIARFEKSSMIAAQITENIAIEFGIWLNRQVEGAVEFAKIDFTKPGNEVVKELFDIFLNKK